MSRPAMVDRPMPKGKAEVSLAAFALLFSELVQYHQARVSNIGELERALEDAGAGVGARLLEVVAWRERAARRDARALDALKFCHGPLWRALFGRAAKDLEQSNTAEDEYMISDTDLYVTRYVSRGGPGVNPAAFVAGVVRGALSAAGFPARVTAHWVSSKPPAGGGSGGGSGGGPPKTTILIKFDASVMEREAAAAAAR